MRNYSKKSQGDEAEWVAAQLLQQRGFTDVENLNRLNPNNPLYDLSARYKGSLFYIDVKSTGKERTLTLHPPHKLMQLNDDDVLMAFLPLYKGSYIDFTNGQYMLWIVPGYIARDEAIYVHNFYIEQGRHYGIDRSKSENTTVKLKDEPNQGQTRISGKFWYSWNSRFRDAWNKFDELTA